MSKPIINIDDLEYQTWSHGNSFDARLGSINDRVGARLLGYNITVLPPGKRAFPLHNHNVNEEMFFVLEGKGEIRIGDQRHAIRQGDVIACPPGGPETAHQIINTAAAGELKFLAVSTRISPEVAYYPDSDKYGVYVSLPDGDDDSPASLRFINRDQSSMQDYWDGEE